MGKGPASKTATSEVQINSRARHIVLEPKACLLSATVEYRGKPVQLSGSYFQELDMTLTGDFRINSARLILSYGKVNVTIVPGQPSILKFVFLQAGDFV